MKCGYAADTEGAVALAAATAKTILGVKSNAAFGLDLVHWEVSFDGVTASAVPVLCELLYLTWATNAPATNSTSVTPKQIYGRPLTHGVTAAKTWTSEPTAVTIIRPWLLTPNGGFIPWEYPLGRTPDCALAEGFAIRCTAPAVVNVRATLEWERA